MNPIIVAQMARASSIVPPDANLGCHALAIGKHQRFTYARSKLS
jgi:hypothetical protein